MSSFSKYFSFLFSRLNNFFQPRLCHSLVPQQHHAARGKNGSLVTRVILSFGILLSSMYFTSCEKVINVDLNDAEKKYVIEAVVTDQAGSCKVLLSETKNFDDDNSFKGISGAQITIADNNGSPVNLAETSPGVYQSSAFIGQVGHTYNLTINVASKVFTATSTMPVFVPFDSLYISERKFFDETNKYATLLYNDPPGKGNAYRYIQYVNGVKEKTVFVRDDDYSDGRTIERLLVFFSDDEDEEEEKKLKTGDSLKVEMLCIDYSVYKYWYSLAEGATGESQSATPSNPVTNIQGDAVGYFSAHTIRSKSIVVK
jgi:hypothetical protein